MSDLTPNLRSIFDRAVEIDSADQRRDFLANACEGAPEVRQQVEALLAAHAAAGSFLASPPRAVLADPGATIETQPAESPGMQIGPYKLLEQIGEGGMGVVYMAEQTQPVQRRVALKVIKAGMGSRHVIARFEAERQALSLMDHPNIAKVLDAGEVGQASGSRQTSGAADSGTLASSATGRPYFVMELVRGVPITQYCDEHHLAPRQRLELLLPVCQAIQHAHQKGVIHRDIKPTNILVAEYDNQPVPKVIDFGVAKAVSQPLTERTIFTGFGQLVGTLEYMSPEQAKLNQLDIDTRSDIYSLGVLMYELLTGSTPFDKHRLRSAAFDEMLRIIREEEPDKPSTRLESRSRGTSGANRPRDANPAEPSGPTLASIAAVRSTEPLRLTKLVRGELDWIVMKALEKDRSRRYETASGFAADVQRYLADEAVQACPPSAAYRFRKFAKRNTASLATAAVVGAALMLGMAISFWQAQRAWRAEALAATRLAAETTARQHAVTEATKATAISHLLQEMLSSANPDQAKGGDYTVRQLLDASSLRMRDQLQGQPEVEAAVRAAIGNAYRGLGLLQNAEPHLEKALELRQRVLGPDHLDVAQSLLDLSWNLLAEGNLIAAEAKAREALVICQKANVKHEKTLTALMQLAFFLGEQRKDAEAQAVADQALAFARDAGYSDHPDVAKLLHDLVTLKVRAGDLPAAEQLAKDALAMHRRMHGVNHPETGWAIFNLGGALMEQKKYSEAETAFREALTTFRRQYDESHRSIFLTSDALEGVLTNQGDQIALDELRADKAARLIKAIERQKGSMRLAGLAAEQCLQLAQAYLNSGNLSSAEPAFEQCIQLYEDLLDKTPDDVQAKDHLAVALAYRGVLLEKMKRLEEAAVSFERATSLWKELSDQAPENEWYRQERAHFSLNLAILLQAAGKPEGALERSRTSVRLNEKLVADFPQHEHHRSRLEHARSVSIGLLRALQRDDDLRIEVEALMKDSSADELNRFAWTLVSPSSASADNASLAVTMAQKAVELSATGGPFWNTKGVAHFRAGQWNEAITALHKSQELRSGGDGFDWFFLAMAHWKLGEKDDARKWHERAVEWMDTNAKDDEELIRFRAEAEELMKDGTGD